MISAETPPRSTRVPGLRGMDFCGGTSRVRPSGNVARQMTRERLRIPHMAGSAGFRTTCATGAGSASSRLPGVITDWEMVAPSVRRTWWVPKLVVTTSFGGRGTLPEQFQQERVFPAGSQMFSARQEGQEMIPSESWRKSLCHSPSVTLRLGSRIPAVKARVKRSRSDAGQYFQRSPTVS